MACDRCYQDETQGEHGVGLCPLERRDCAPVVRPDDIVGGLEIFHGLCNEDGTPRTYYSQSEITAECKRRGLVRWTDCHEANRTKDAEVRIDWMKSGEARRQKADRDERRAAGERINTWTRTAPKQNSPETRAQITQMVRQRLQRYA